MLMADLERQLKNKLYRVDCPESLELGEYRLEMLTAERRRSIREHLQICPHCRRELTSLDFMLEDLKSDLSPGVMARVRVWVGELLSTRSNAMDPVFGLRGDSGTGQAYDFQAGEARIMIEVQENAQGQKTLLGLVLGINQQDLTAALWQQGERLQQVAVDELGNFVITDIPSGEYDLIVSRPDEEYHLQSLKV